MSSAEEFNQSAAAGAESAKTERKEAILPHMAAAWLEIAERWEAAKKSTFLVGACTSPRGSGSPRLGGGGLPLRQISLKFSARGLR